MYDPDWDDPLIIWPPYSIGRSRTACSPSVRPVTSAPTTASKLTMIDHWFGRLLDEFDRQGRWDDTAVIVTTDHGHYLGEHDVFGKPGVPLYRPMSHIPLMVAWPGLEAGARGALTTSVDLHATLAEVFDVDVDAPHPRPLARATADRPDRVGAGLGAGRDLGT